MFRLEPGQVAKTAALHALKKAGYVHLDTANYYQNELDVGRAVRESGIARENIFVTSKVIPSARGKDYAVQIVENSLRLIDIGYIDQYLLHAPLGGKILESYDVLVEYQQRGLIRSIGVSNFGVAHLEALKNSGRPLPQTNQIEMHPWCIQADIVDWCRANNVVVVASSPLGKARRLFEPNLVKIANKHNKTSAQVLIRWSLQSGFVTIPKSSQAERIDENANVFDFELDEEDMHALSLLRKGEDKHVAGDPTKNDLASCFGPTE